jgi:hypothetical protein
MISNRLQGQQYGRKCSVLDFWDNGLAGFLSRSIITVKLINLLRVYVPIDFRDNIHNWLKVSLIILVLIQILGTEKATLIGLFLIVSDSLSRRAIQKLEWTPA